MTRRTVFYVTGPADDATREAFRRHVLDELESDRPVIIVPEGAVFNSLIVVEESAPEWGGKED